MKIRESAENYLETILELYKKNGKVRSIDIANELGYSKPSISVAMKHFRENGYVTIDELGYITLTEAGKSIAESMAERHSILTEYLISIGVSAKTASEDACRIEHVISEESFEKMKQHLLTEHKK